MFKSLYWRSTVGALAVVGTLGLSLRGVSWPSKAFWSDNSSVALAAVAAVTFAAINGVFEAVRNIRRERGEVLELNLHQPLSALFVSLLDELGPEQYKNLGVHCFLVRRRFPWLRRELVRVCGFALKIRPHSGVRWTKGKGLIGQCWSENGDVEANLAQAWAELRELSEDEWNQLDPITTYRLNYQEYKNTKRYEAIVATPIQKKGGAFAGCISIDSTARNYESLWSDRIRELMQNAAQVVAKVAKLS